MVLAFLRSTIWAFVCNKDVVYALCCKGIVYLVMKEHCRMNSPLSGPLFIVCSLGTTLSHPAEIGRLRYASYTIYGYTCM